MKVWIRNTLLLAVCLGSMGLVVGRMLKNPTGPDPRSFDAAQFSQRGFLDVVDRVDQAFSNSWAAGKQTPAGRAQAHSIYRRISLALTGTIPSLEEIRALESRGPGNHDQWFLSRLLEDRRTSDYFAERFARVAVGVENGPFIIYRRHRLVSWLSDQIQANRPYDQMVREMIAAEGIWTSHPAVNFITVTVDQNNKEQGPDEQKLAARVSRAFLGQRMDCVQCHNDMFGNRWKQKDFHQLAAFFAKAEMSMTGVRDDPEKHYEYRYLGRPAKEPVPPRVPFNSHLLPGDGPLRERLASWVTHPENRPFARMLVNRTWAFLFNRPLHKPLDDIPMNGPFPTGMEILADDLVSNRFDFHRLIRIIVATQAFQAESRRPGNSALTDGESSFQFASFPLSRLRPEQVGASILQASRLRTLDAESPTIVRLMRFFQQKDFVTRYGDIGEDEFGDLPGTLPQRLVMMNGRLVHDRTKEDLVLNASTRIGALARDEQQAVEMAYLTALTRKPTREESDYFTQKLKEPSGSKRSQRMEDLFWILMNSTEFSWNH